ncbi:hypothetical protein [Desulfogranum marinum]|uniref:hypothetical protein n=1 Tax=Desulfogranum marinum TaxID=453220 RepID=UPI001966C63C|nr:hypothetical protein [Desulfogranum marinum]MBM9513992.1 hypothetical protein [Desulfogranum marinum]
MKWWKFFSLFFLCLLLAGCAGLSPHSSAPKGQQAATVIFSPTDCDSLLACLEESRELSRNDFKAYYKRVALEVDKDVSGSQLQLICLSLHHYASYKQFKRGMGMIEEYIELHPEERQSLQGLYRLVERINQEKINRWSQRNRLMDEKETLEEENRELFDTGAALEKQIEQDSKRISELEKQIEQLKNIENIIKNREL